MKTWNCVNGKFALLALSCLVIDNAKQRARRPNWLKKLRDNWNPRMCGAICVCPNGDGTYHVPDAAHRLTILKEKHRGGTEAMCMVVDSAAQFEQLNAHLAVNANDKFKVMLACDEQPEVRIAAILAKNGIGIYYGSRPPLGHTAAPAAFKSLYIATGSLFPKVVEMMADCFCRESDGQIDPAALAADFVRGMCSFLVNTSYTLEEAWAAFQNSNKTAADIMLAGREKATNGFARWKEIAILLEKEVKRSGYKGRKVA